MARDLKRGYKSTESKYKGGAKEMYITYDLKQETRGDGSAMYPKVKRVYIAGDVKDWKTGGREETLREEGPWRGNQLQTDPQRL